VNKKILDTLLATVLGFIPSVAAILISESLGMRIFDNGLIGMFAMTFIFILSFSYVVGGDFFDVEPDRILIWSAFFSLIFISGLSYEEKEISIKAVSGTPIVSDITYLNEGSKGKDDSEPTMKGYIRSLSSGGPMEVELTSTTGDKFVKTLKKSDFKTLERWIDNQENIFLTLKNVNWFGGFSRYEIGTIYIKIGEKNES